LTTNSQGNAAVALREVTARDQILALLPELVAALRDSAAHSVVRETLPGVMLTARQMAALIQLQLYGAQTMSDFAAGMAVSPATATEMIERLEERGLVVRERDESDRRVILVHLSPAAAAQAQAVMDQRRLDIEQALERCPNVCAEDLAGFLRVFIDQLSAERGR